MPTWVPIVTCMICWAVWPLVMKSASKSISPLMIQIVIAYVHSMFAPIMFLYMKATGVIADWSPKGMMFAGLACVLTTTASLSFSTAIQKAPIHLVMGFVSIYPVLTFALSMIFLGETVTVLKFFGIIAIVLGTLMLSW